MLALHQAIEEQNEAAVRALLKEGADVNLADLSVGGARPLHIAVDIECEDACRRYDAGESSAHPEAIFTKLLVEAGADPCLPDGRGQTPIEWAQERKHMQAVEVFSAT